MLNNNFNIYDPWVVSLVSAFVALVTPSLIRLVVERIRAYRGAFSGKYLAVSYTGQRGQLLVEKVDCKQVGNRIIGHVIGIGIFTMTQAGQIETINTFGRYSFNGVIENRNIVLSYRANEERWLGIGTIVLKASVTGRKFIGVWSGYGEHAILSGFCIWMRIDRKFSWDLENEKLVEKVWAAEKELNQHRKTNRSNLPYRKYINE